MKTEFIIRCIYALCLIGAGFNHLQTVLMHGLFWDYNNAPLFTCIYWTSLTFIDPLAAILLFYRPRIGLILTFLIIFSDVIHNTWITLKVGRDLLNYMYISQFLFLVLFCAQLSSLGRHIRQVEILRVESKSILLLSK